MLWLSDNPPASEVQEIVDWIKEQHPGVDCEFLVDENQVLTGFFLQDVEIKSTFDRFPEVLLADSTYKTNNLNMALYVLLCIDGNGGSHLICAFFVLNEDKASLTDMVNHFKNRNQQWSDVRTIITDKDMTERTVFKSCVPSVNLQICLYHTLRTFSREVTMDKMKITSAERASALGHLEKHPYAHSKTDYGEKYLAFISGAPGTVVANYNSNWHHISSHWVKGLKSYHLKNDTTNRVESFFSKLKTFFSPRSS